MDVYGELLTFKERLLTTADESIRKLKDSAARYEATATDMTVLKAEQDRLVRRHKYWQKRYRQLSRSAPS